MKKRLHYLGLSLFLLLFFSKTIAQDIETIAKEKPFEVSGSFTLFSSYYNVNGIDPRRKDFTWYITGNPNFKIYGIDIPFSLIVSEQERTFRQPFNQFLISPSYKWAKLHLGYTNLNWSPFTWSGQTAFGAGVELNPKKFRFGFMYGRLNRAVEEDITSLEVQTPSFKRMGYSARLGYGTETSYVNLIYLKGKDDENSLNTIPTKTEVLPAENVVVGLTSKVKFTDKLFWSADVASSAFTRDIRALPFIDDEPGFVKSLSSLLQTNSSTQFYKAYQTDVSYIEKKFKIKAKYKRIEPDFKSMGAYYFQTDVENITLEPSLNITKYKLRINTSIGQQKDNLLNQKSFTSKRLIGTIGADWSPTKIFGINALYANYSGEQSKGLKIPNQATQQSFVSQNITVSPRLTFVKEKITHFHNLVANKQWLVDKNPNTSLLTEYEVNNLNLTSSLVLNKKALIVSGSFLYAQFISNANTNQLNGYSLTTNKAFFDAKLLTSISGSQTFQKLNSEPFSQMLTISTQNTYKITSHHGLTFLVQYLNNQSKTDSFNTFTEFNIDLGYTYTF